MVKLHQKYLLNKLNLIITIILTIMEFIFQIVIANPFAKEVYLMSEKIESLNNYNSASILFTRMLVVLWSICLFGFGFNKDGDNYSIILQSKVSRKKYFYSKILAISVELLKLLFLLFLINIWIGTLSTNWYIIKIHIIVEYIKIYLFSLIYGYLSLLFMRVFKSVFSVILTTISYIASEIFMTENISEKILCCIQLLLPTEMFDGTSYQLTYGMMHLVILTMLYLLLGYQMYCFKKE